MATTRNNVARGAGGVSLRRYADDRLLYINTASKYTFDKSTTEGDKVQGFNIDGNKLDLDTSGSTEEYSLEIASQKNNDNINEAMLDSVKVNNASLILPHTEVVTLTGVTYTLTGTGGGTGTLVAGSVVATFLDQAKLAKVTTAPNQGQYKDNGDGTLTFNASDVGATIVLWYNVTRTNVQTQGGAAHVAMGYLNALFYQKVGTSTTTGNALFDQYWFPKCSLSGETSFEFSSDVQDKTFKLTALIPDTPTGWQKPYQVARGLELATLAVA